MPEVAALPWSRPDAAQALCTTVAQVGAIRHVAELAADAGPVCHRAERALEAVADIVPCDGAVLAMWDPWQHTHRPVADFGLNPAALDYCCSPSFLSDPGYQRVRSDGAVQYAITQHASKIVFDQANVPGAPYGAAGPAALAAAAHVPIKTETDNVPVSDANSVALRLVNDAGPSGAVVLNFTPPEALVILQAAQKLGLENRVKLWGWSTPCNTDFLAHALGPK